MNVRVIRPGDGEPLVFGQIQARIIEDGSHTDHRIGLMEATVPPGSSPPPQHIHREHDEVFILTAGKLRFTTGTEHIDAEAGSVVVVPIGAPHTFSNPFDEPAVMLNTFTPDLYIQYFRDLGELPVDEHGRLAPADVGRVMARYATDVVPPGGSGT
jgi:quercetin dioxygenase-like cupin family protein